MSSEQLPVTRTLQSSTVMVTGDSVDTGAYFARKCGIIDNNARVVFVTLNCDGDDVLWTDSDGHEMNDQLLLHANRQTYYIALTGDAWNLLRANHKDQMQSLVPDIRMVGRCSPYDKVSVVEEYTHLGFVTMMCGDGGNDSGALKAAHVGLALSEHETASTLAPFTCLNKDIASVLTVLGEGRCTMATMVSLFKFILIYATKQAANFLLQAILHISGSDAQYACNEIWTVTICFAMALSLPSTKLSRVRPNASFIDIETLGGIAGFLVVHALYLVGAWIMLTESEWFACRSRSNWAMPNIYVSDTYEVEVIFLMAGYQVLISGAVLNMGYEFRRRWWRNLIFTGACMIFLGFHVYITLYPGYISCFWRVNCENRYTVRSISSSKVLPTKNAYGSNVMLESFRYKLAGLFLGDFCALFLFDTLGVHNLLRRFQQKRQQSQPSHEEPQDEEQDSVSDR